MRETLPPVGEEEILSEETLEDGTIREALDRLVVFTVSNPTRNDITVEGGSIWLRLPSESEPSRGVSIQPGGPEMDREPPVQLRPRTAWRVQVNGSRLVRDFELRDHDHEYIIVEVQVVDVMGNSHSDEFELELDEPLYRLKDPDTGFPLEAG